MPPKGKKIKKQDDNWEAEALGEDPIAAATAAAKADDATEEADEEFEGGAVGLLASARKNKEKRAKKGKPVQNDFVEGEGATEEASNGTAAIAEKAPEEADAEDIFAAPIKGKGAKGKKQPAAKQQNDDGDEDDEDAGGAGGRVKTKKEKEKEKKEREKQRKKEQAAKKKTSAPVEESEKVEPEKVEEIMPTEPEPAVPKGKDAKGAKTKLNPRLAMLQKQMAERQKLEEEQAQLKAQEEERIREIERLEEERAKADADLKARKKEREKEKKEELRKQGLLLTKTQREAKRAAELRKAQLLESGVTVEGLEDDGAPKKKPIYEKKKKTGNTGPSKAEEEARRLEEAKKQAEAEAEKLAAEREAKRQEEERIKAEEEAAVPESDAEEDWEAAADAEEEDVKESWDADTDEEADKKAAQQKPDGQANGKTVETKVKLQSKASNQDGKKLPLRTSKRQNSSSDDDDDSSDEEGKSATQLAAEKRKAEAAARKKQLHEEALAAQSKDNLRSPICCILGHVDTGKTKLLDKIRQTNVQEGEAGGITQQIGATFFPVDALKQKTAVVNKDGKFDFKIPGLLVIDTPGHESFTNLRSRGSSLCNIAILVVDIMHGLEPQTLESMRLLRDRKTPFIVALNKIDRLYGWRKIDNNGFQDSLALQNKAVQQEFKNRLDQTKLAFAEQGFNAELFYENKSMARNVSLVPTSAHTGEGIPDMIKLITQLTQERMTGKLMYLAEVECTVLEVKVIEGLGTTIDVVLSNGVLNEGDRIVLCGLNGAITTNIRALLTPQPLKELRVKSSYVHNQQVKASLGVKIAANDLEHAIAGSRLLVVGPDDDEEDLEEEVMSDIENLLSRVSKTGRGVSVQASTLGSLEALLEFLKVSKIPVANISIGPVFKRDVMQAGIMLEKAREFAVMLCFDVKVDPSAQQYAEEVGVKIFQADIIYHLFDNFTAHMAQLAEQRKEESKMSAVFPCVLKPVAVFNKKDPIVVGVDVTEGNLRPLTPIAVVKNNPITNLKEVFSLGRVTSIERDHKQVPICKKGQPSVAVKIEGPNQPMYGRQLEEGDTLYAMISRKSIDTLKEFYRSDVSNEEWLLIKKLKPLFDIP